MATPSVPPLSSSPLDAAGLHGFPMPDPYALHQYTQSLLPDPDTPTPDDVHEALQLWGVPEGAYPPEGSSGKVDVICKL